ncbi:sigma-54-dependent transcriptional regulator [Desulfobacula phenolica]|uniref:DNA-binding transcriptional response regulator, NtrC family, contains REC, AAA-type ATPase, and a Fis-type DNA-binding domains n=1 Tax=Desulfobacula phenolica TaxID=90732 RepID=A0A1H2DTB2_9BACT|nr:sigma-54 dependent transcriptional regulator [Desulfobacula phenolica]SDT86056.1 DNA-binding transcriptional response regulator, NtrC family, contains REC, AAA-type ATPase, and a Fis-type DNA-binding domains [Desulfobacula phenolica]
MKKILLVDDQESVLTSLSILLRRNGFHVVTAKNPTDAKCHLVKEDFNLVLTDLRMKKPYDGLQVLKDAKAFRSGIHVIIMTAFGTIENAVDAMTMGADDYITKGFSNKELIKKINKILKKKKFKSIEQPKAKEFHKIVGKSKPLRNALEIIRKVAPTDSCLMIHGDSGTGKELIAKTIHRLSLRKDKIFLPVNCAAFSDTLLESELFGHIKGSFTGADTDKHGLFCAAHTGTLFLDEVSEMSKAMQARLLRVLQEKNVTPVGSTSTYPVDVRIICATNKDLLEEVSAGNFREDLYFRLCVIPIVLPSLEERKEDIPLLVDFFINNLSKKFLKKPIKIDKKAMDLIMERHWQGNIRELENFIERMILLLDKPVCNESDIISLLPPVQSHKSTPSPSSLSMTESEQILNVLQNCNWNQSLAAKKLGIGRTTLWRKIKQYDITHQLQV